MHHIVVMMLAAATVGMVMAPENAMRHPVGNQIDFATVSAMEHFFGQVRPFVVMHGMVHANDALHLMRKRHQVVRHDHNRHRLAEFCKHAVKRFNPRHIDIVGRLIQKENFRIGQSARAGVHHHSVRQDDGPNNHRYAHGPEPPSLHPTWEKAQSCQLQRTRPP